MSDETVIIVHDSLGLIFWSSYNSSHKLVEVPEDPFHPMFNGTFYWINLNSSVDITNGLFISFRGIPPITIYGFTPPLGYNQSYGLPGSGTTNLPLPLKPPPGTGGPLLTIDSDLDSDIYAPNLLVLDYTTYPVSDKYHNLTGETILVDDTSPEIHWKGNWTMNKDEEMTVAVQTLPDVDILRQWWPHGNSTHSCQATNQDSFTFRFKGTSIKVVGSYPGVLDSGFQFPNNFFLSLNFTLDTTFHRQDFSGPGDGPPAHFTYFSVDSLDPNENHTLTMSVIDKEIEKNTSSPFQIRIDYLTYTPSFTNLFGKPDLSGEFSSDGPTTASTGNNGSSSVRIGAVAGGVIGGIILFALMALATWLCWRKRRSLKSFQDITQTMMETPTAFTLRAPIQPNTHSEKAKIIAASTSPHILARRHSFNGFSSTSTRGAEEFQTIPDLAVSRLLPSTDQTNLQANDIDVHENPILGAVEDGEERPAENGYRELMTRIDILTAAFRRYAGPPEYVSEYRSEAGQ
ncbi:hypothetical protein VKT23_006132 [Stygiomarasmius scandens]|uniref:Uncharacterized protein n=1 Tax=Marasmiellus scandens TaxID=2682957 RepID=A0ABR1JVP6_9AGAR